MYLIIKRNFPFSILDIYAITLEKLLKYNIVAYLNN